MAEYIEREAAEKILYDGCHTSNGRECPDDVVELWHIVQAIPAADVVPVVRCKECQNSYEWANVDGDNYRYCGYMRDRWNRDYDRMVDDDDFCKWGRKMDGGWQDG